MRLLLVNLLFIALCVFGFYNAYQEQDVVWLSLSAAGFGLNLAFLINDQFNRKRK